MEPEQANQPNTPLPNLLPDRTPFPEQRPKSPGTLPSSFLSEAYTSLKEIFAVPAKKAKDLFSSAVSFEVFFKKAPLSASNQKTQPSPAIAILEIASEAASRAYAFETVIKSIGWPEVLPGPGNGYFEAVRLLLKNIDELAEAASLPRDDYRDEYSLLFNRDMNSSPLDPGTRYPIELYFLSLNIFMKKDLDSSRPPPFEDIWTVALRVSVDTKDAAIKLCVASQNLFLCLRKEKFELFPKLFKLFDEAWIVFFRALMKERQEGTTWIGTLELGQTLAGLANNERFQSVYQEKLREFDLAVKDFHWCRTSLAKELDILEHIQHRLQEENLEVNSSQSGPIPLRSLIIKSIRQAARDPFLKTSLEEIISKKDPALCELIPQLVCMELAKLKVTNEQFPVLFQQEPDEVNNILMKMTLLREKSSFAFHTLRRALFTHALHRVRGSQGSSSASFFPPVKFETIYNQIDKFKQEFRGINVPAGATELEIKEIMEAIRSMRVVEELSYLSRKVQTSQEEAIDSIVYDIFKKYTIITRIPDMKIQSLANKIVNLGAHTLEIPPEYGIIKQKKITPLVPNHENFGRQF